MLTVSSIFLLIVVSICSGQTTSRICPPDTVDFATKVEKSSVVVYGKPMAKIMNDGSDSVFQVSFQVDCIFKGPATLRQINIIDAGKNKKKQNDRFHFFIFAFLGRVDGKIHCQDLPVGRGYAIVFLEPASSNTTDRKTYVPADFVEIVDHKNSTASLLARACNLHRIAPLQTLASVADVCPAVGTDPICLETGAKVTKGIQAIVPANATTVLVGDLQINSSNQTVAVINEHDHLSHPIHSAQQELETIKSKSGSHQVDVDSHNSSVSITFNLLLLFVAIFVSLY